MLDKPKPKMRLSTLSGFLWWVGCILVLVGGLAEFMSIPTAVVVFGAMLVLFSVGVFILCIKEWDD